ncbi:MAG: Ig-like domain-containing protein, partial [Muribaculaceae bacterium]|nr:Ig-like domain-containing protein [Muribaculaceae bacterium]
VTVNPIVAETVTLNVEDLTLLIGASEKLTATVTPDNTTDKTVVWTSDKPEIATVSEDGTVTGIAVGTATITATCGEVSANCTVTVNSPVIEPTAIILSAENLWILKGRKESVTAQVLPADTTDPEIIWSTADPSIASIDQSGIVTAISAGVTNIYATCGEITATCTVTVGDRPDAPTKMERKGNGASRTFVILMPLNDDELAEKGYDFVYGYTDAKGDDHVFASTPLRYSHTTSEIYNNPDNDFWVFAVVANEDGENVASVRCHLDGSEDDDFDAASLIEAGNSTRSKNYENWIIPTPHGARISIRSCGETSIAAYTLDGNRIFNENYGAGVDVDAHLTDEILPPSTYIIVAVSGDYISTKKIIIR